MANYITRVSSQFQAAFRRLICRMILMNLHHNHLDELIMGRGSDRDDPLKQYSLFLPQAMTM